MIPNDQKAVLDNVILQILRRDRRGFGLEASAVCNFLAPAGFSLTPDDAEKRLEYLTAKGLADETDKVLHQEIRAWKIIKGGREYLDQQNL